MKIVLVCHNDLDGLGCQLVLERIYPELEAFPLSYEQIDDWLEKYNFNECSHLFIADVFCKEQKSIDLINKLVKNGLKVLIFDHHLTSAKFQQDVQAEFADYGDDTAKRCSTKRLYQWAFPQGDGPASLVETINYYDTCGDNESLGGLFNKLFNYNGRNWAYHYLKGRNEITLDAFCLKSLAEYKRKAELAFVHVKRQSKTFSINNYSIVVAPVQTYKDEVFHKLGQEFDIVITVTGRKLSFRTGNSKLVRVDKIAQLFLGGGGHPSAAGATLPVELKYPETHIIQMIKDNKNVLELLIPEKLEVSKDLEGTKK